MEMITIREYKTIQNEYLEILIPSNLIDYGNEVIEYSTKNKRVFRLFKKTYGEFLKIVSNLLEKRNNQIVYNILKSIT